MRAYGQYCPIARAAEVLERRWTLIIVRNLLVGCRTPAEIEDGAPGIPKALLRERLEQLEALGIVERQPKRRGRGWHWQLTDAGLALAPVCEALTRWGEGWLTVGPEQQEPYSVLWSLCRVLGDGALPADRFVARFEVCDARVSRLWLLADGDCAEVCAKPPGFEEDVVVRTDRRTLLDWHLGSLTIGQAMHAGRLTADGSREAIRTVARWGGHGAVFEQPRVAGL